MIKPLNKWEENQI